MSTWLQSQAVGVRHTHSRRAVNCAHLTHNVIQLQTRVKTQKKVFICVKANSTQEILALRLSCVLLFLAGQNRNRTLVRTKERHKPMNNNQTEALETWPQCGEIYMNIFFIL